MDPLQLTIIIVLIAAVVASFLILLRWGAGRRIAKKKADSSEL